MSQNHSSSPSQACRDENHQQFPPRAPDTTRPLSYHRYHDYPLISAQPQLYGSGGDRFNQLNHIAYPGSSQPDDHYSNPPQYMFQPPATQRNHNLATAAITDLALTDCTCTITNSTEPHSEARTGRNRKHKPQALTEAEHQKKCRRLPVENVTHATTLTAHGIGPINHTQATPDVISHSLAALPPRARAPLLGSLVDSHASTSVSGKSVASDVWYFMVGVESDVVGPWPSGRLVHLPPPEELKLRLSKERSNPDKCKHFCCRLCRLVLGSTVFCL